MTRAPWPPPTPPAQVLSEVKTPDGRQRFFPTGQHPASKRYRDQLARLREIERVTVMVPSLQQAINYTERQIAEIELVEDRAKRAYLAASR